MEKCVSNAAAIANLKRLRAGASGFSIVAGVAVLGGWMFDVLPLKTLLPGLSSMKANTALGLLLLGCAVGLMSRAEGRGKEGKRFQVVADALAAIAVCVALTTLAEYVFGWRAGIDELFFRDVHPDGHSLPGRMAPHTAAAIALLGSAVLLGPLESRQGRRIAQFVSLVPMLIALAAILGYLYSAVSFYRILSFTGMAVHTATAIFLLALAMVLSPVDRGFARLISSESLGGMVARQLLPAAVIVPMAIGWIRLEGQKAGLYGTEVGLALMVTANVIIFTTLIYLSGMRIHKIAEAREEAQRSLEQSREGHLSLHYTFEAVVDACPLAVVTMDAEQRVQLWNAAAERMLGWSPLEVRGRECPVIPDDRREEFRRVTEVVKGGEQIGIESIALTREEERIPIVMWAAPMVMGRRGFCGYVLLLEDVRQRSRMVEQVQ